MNFISRIWNAFKKEVGVSWSPFAGSGDASSRVTQSSLMDNNKNWVYVCVDKIADAVSSVPLQLMKYNKTGDDTEVFDHEALNLLYKPNEQMSGRDFRYITVAHQELTGNAYWLKDSENKPKVLFPLNPKYVQPKLANDKMSILNYKYQMDVQTLEYAAKLICHLKYPNPSNPLFGIGTLEPIAEWVDVDNYATEFNRKFFINGASFGGMIESEASTPEAQALIRFGVENMHKGVANAHKVGIMPKGAKWVESSMTPKDMEFMEADARFRDKILAAFGVPKSVVGIVEDVNRANAESSNYVFMSFTVKPKLDRFITWLNEFYLPMFDEKNQYYFTYKDPTPENMDIQIREDLAALGNAPYKTVNEVRGQKGLPPISGGDVVYGNPFQAPIGGPADEPVKSAQPKEKRAPRVDRKASAVDLLVGKVFDLVKSKATKEEVEAQHKEFITRVTTFEQKFATAIKEHDRKQHNKVLDYLRGKVKAITRSELLDFDAEVSSMVDLLTPILNDLSLDEGTRAMLLLHIDQQFDPSSVRLQKVIEASVKRMSKSYTRTTLDLLVSKINDGIQLGEGMDKIAARVSGVYDLTEEYRAVRVARTEVFSTANDAAREAYQQSDVVKTLKWVTAEDEMTCEFCAPLNDKIVDVEQGFFDRKDTAQGDDGGELSLDYEKVENPPLHPNCRCFIVPEEISVKSMEAKTKEQDVDDELIKLLEENG